MAEPLYDPSTEVLARGRDGSLRAVPKAEIDQVAASGGQLLSAEESQAALQRAARFAEAQTLGGQIQTGAGAVASGVLAPFAALGGGTGEQAFAGLSGALSEVAGGQDTSQRDYAQLQLNAEANPTLQMLGSTVGTTATGFLGGAGIGMAGGKLATALGSEALAGSLASGGTLSQLAGKAITAAPTAVGFAAENALGGIGAANEQAFLENRTLAADEVAGAGLIGAGLGMGIGAAARGLGWAGNKVAQKVASRIPEGFMQEVAEKAAFRDLAQGAKQSAFKRALSENAELGSRRLGRRQLDEGLTGMAAPDALAKVQSRLGETGAVFERIGAEAADHVDNAWLVEKVAKQVEDLEARAVTKSGQRLASEVDGQLKPLFERLKQGENVTFKDIQNARTQIREASRGMTNPAQKRAYKQLERSLGDTLEEAVKRTDDAQGVGGKLVKEWKDANAIYSDLATMRDAYSSRVAKEQSDKVFSFGEQHSGGQAAILGSLATGNLGTGALLGLGTAAARKMVREKGAGWVARAADAMAKNGEIPSVTKLLAASSRARQQLGGFAINQMVQRAARGASEGAPAGFAYGAFANYQDPKRVSTEFADASRFVESSRGDLEGMAARANEHLGALAQEQPELAMAAQQKMATAIGYLQDNMPPSPQRSVIATSLGTESKRLPPTFQQVAWLKRFRATVDPSVIYGEIARGYVNPETVETLQTLYPAYYATVTEGVLSHLNGNPDIAKQMTYSQRLALDNLMGSQGLVEPTRRLSVQDRLAQAQQEATQQAGAPAPSARKAPEIAQFGVTTSARLMST
jgi:hypothetical protein